MNPIEELPNFSWSRHSRDEIAITGPALIAASDFAVSLGEVAIAGLIYNSFTSPPWFWFALTESVSFRDLIDFRALREYIPQGSLTAVREDFLPGHRFAKFYGFSPTDRFQEHLGKVYCIYRRD